jgi:signal transduction histidine kinase
MTTQEGTTPATSRRPGAGRSGGRSDLGPQNDLLQAVLALASHLDLATVLQEFVETGARLTGARYAAIGVLDTYGETSTFVHTGMRPDVVEELGHPPRGHGVLGAIPADDVLRLDDLTKHPDFGGFPAAHPPMHSFLGVSVRVHDRIYGRLYLTEKEGGFTEEDATTVRQLATAAAVAIENSQTFASAQDRERWLRVEQEITTTLLSGAEEEEALEMIAARVRQVAAADTAIIVLPSVGDSWVMEIVDGDGAAEFIGTVMPPEGRAMTVLRSGQGLIVDSLSRARVLTVPAMRRYGPALYAPMRARGRGIGVLILLRREDRPPFVASDLKTAESFAGQAALALVLAEARHAQDVAALLDERARIARDLHDLAIQQLFATGMQLEAARNAARAGRHEPVKLAAILESALAGVDDSVRQIRSIVQSLRDPDEDVTLVERLRREASLARAGLGFAPSLLIDVDGMAYGAPDDDPAIAEVIDARIDADLADDVVAVVREGLANSARHARASSVFVRVSVTGAGPSGRVHVSVEDDGSGVDPRSTRRSGVDNLAARARRHGGWCTLRSAHTGDGSLLSWEAPLN